MKPDPALVRRKALHAAASVVLAFSMGCVDKDDDADDLGDDDHHQDSDDDDDDGGDDGGDAGGDAGGDDTATTGDDTGSGVDDTGSGVDDTGSGGDDTGEGGDDTGEGVAPDCTATDVDVAACCDELSVWCATEHGDGTDAFTECVWGPDFDGSTGCVPWGPPVPPKMA